jgi:glucoamylase
VKATVVRVADGEWRVAQRPSNRAPHIDEFETLAAGRDPLPFLEAMTAMASPGGMLPEQVWDADPIPSRRLEPGRPTGSAIPLVWAHAAFIKLMVSRHLGRPVDRPRAVWRRYQGRRPTARHAFWWPHAQIDAFYAGSRLAVALPLAALVHWAVRTGACHGRADP